LLPRKPGFSSGRGNSGDSIQQLTLDAGRKEILEKKEGVSCHNRIEKPQVDNTYKMG